MVDDEHVPALIWEIEVGEVQLQIRRCVVFGTDVLQVLELAKGLLNVTSCAVIRPPPRASKQANNTVRALKLTRTSSKYTRCYLHSHLLLFAKTIENHQWEKAMRLCEEEHLAMQRDLFFSEDEEHPADPNNRDDQLRFLHWYLKEVLGANYVDNHIDQIHHIEILAIEEPFGENGPLKVVFRIVTMNSGPRSGWFFVDRNSYAVFGAVG